VIVFLFFYISNIRAQDDQQKFQWQEEAQQHFNQAVSLQQQNNFDQAEIEFKKALELFNKAEHPRNATIILYNLGFLKYNQQKYNEALDYYEDVLKNNSIEMLPDIKNSTIIQMGWCYFNISDYAKANEVLKIALTLTEKQSQKYNEVLYGLGISMFNQAQYDSSLVYLNRIELNSPFTSKDIYILDLKSRAYFNIGDYEMAIEILQDLRKQPSFSKETEVEFNLILLLAKSYSILGDYEKNIRILTPYANRSFLNTHPQEASEIYYYLGSSYFNIENSDHEKALIYLLKTDSIYQNNQVAYKNSNTYFSLGLIYFDQKNYAQAIEYFNLSVELTQPKGNEKFIALTYENIGHAYKNSHQNDQAVSHYKKAIDWYQKINENQRIEQLQLVIQEVESDFNAKSVIKTIENSRGDESFSRTLNNARNIAIKLSEQGEMDDAKMIFNKCINGYKEMNDYLELIETQYRFGFGFYQNDQIDSALYWFQQAENNDQDLELKQPTLIGKIHYMIAVIYTVQRRYSESLKRFDLSIEILSNTEDTLSLANAYFQKGISLYNQEQNLNALENFNNAGEYYKLINNYLQLADCYRYRGKILLEMDNYADALANLNEAEKVFVELNDYPGLAECRINISQVYLYQGDPDHAMRILKDTKEIFKKSADQVNQGSYYKQYAEIEFSLGNYQSAINKYQQAIAEYKKVEEYQMISNCHQNIALANFNLTHYKEAKEYYRKALEIEKFPQYRKNVISISIKMGNLFLLTDEEDSVIFYFDKAKNLTDPKDLESLSKIYFGKANYYAMNNQMTESISQYEQIMQLAQQTQNFALIAETQKNLGDCYYSINQMDQAYHYYQQAMKYYENNSDYKNYCYLIEQFAMNFYHDEDYEKAIDEFEKCKRIADANQLKDFQLSSRISLGNIFNVINQNDSTHKNLSEGISIASENNDSISLSALFINMGNFFHHNVQFDSAYYYFNKSLELAKQIPDSLLISKGYLNLGNVYFQKERFAKSLEYIDSCLLIARMIGHDKGIALANNNIGLIKVHLNRYQEAIVYFQAADSILANIHSSTQLEIIYGNLGVCFEMIGEYDSAFHYYEKAIDLVEEVRSGFKREEFMISFFENKKVLYDQMINLLTFRLKNFELALHYINLSKIDNKEEFYEDVLQLQQDSSLISLYSQSKDIKKKIKNDEATYQQELEKPKQQQNQAKIKAISKRIAKNKQEYHNIVYQLSQDDPDYDNLTLKAPYALGKTKENIPSNAYYVVFYPASNLLYTFLLSKDKEPQIITSEVSRKTLDSLVLDYRRQMNVFVNRVENNQSLNMENWKADWVAPLKSTTTQLYQYLIEPLENELSEKELIVFIPTGMLYYLPIHALAKENSQGDLEFVIENWNVTYLPHTDLGRINNANQQMKNMNNAQDQEIFIFANADNTLESAQKTSILLNSKYKNVTVYAKEEATEDRATDSFKQGTIFVFDVHTHLNLLDPQYSYIHLNPGTTEDGKLYMKEIMGHTFKNENVDLVMLTTCNSAVGGNKPGAVVRCIAESFSVAGSPSVIATLWPVADQSTGEFELSFFNHYLRNNQTKANALRKAQLELMHNQKYPVYHHPLFWAPFVLIGLWE